MAKQKLRTYKIQIIAQVTLDDKQVDLLNVSAFTSSFAINTIPTATLTIAVGNTAKDDPVAVTILKTIQATYNTAIKVYVQWYTKANNLTPRLLVFDGEIVGSGWQRSGNSSNLQFYLKHWARYLDFASALSASIHPGSPANLARSAVERPVFLDAASGGTENDAGSGWIAALSNSTLPQAAITDLWDYAILPFFQDIVKSNKATTALAGVDLNSLALAAANEQLTQKILQALERTRRVPLVPAAAPNPNLPGTLALRLRDAANNSLVDEDLVRQKIEQTIFNRNADGFIHNTIWGKLLNEYCSTFMFELIPRVNDMLAIPAIGAYRDKFHSTIELDIQTDTNVTLEADQPFRAVVLAYPYQSTTGIDNGTSPLPIDTTSGFGVFSTKKPGTVLYKMPPDWLQFNTRAAGGEAEGLGNPIAGQQPPNPGVVITSLGESPTATEVNANPNGRPGDKQAQNVKNAKSIANLLAQQIYINEALKSRMCTLVMWPDYSISPGSHVRVEYPAELAAVQPNLAGKDNQYMYAKVMQVVHMFDAQGGTAATTLTLTHCRSAAEDQLDEYSMVEPALYLQGWVGGNLA